MSERLSFGERLRHSWNAFVNPIQNYQYDYGRSTYINPNRVRMTMGNEKSIQGDDFCAFTFMFPLKGEAFGIKTRSYISSKTLYKLPRSMRDKYEEFIQEGSLCVLEGVTLEMDQVYDDLDNHINENNYNVICLGYDPYNAKDFVNRWEIDNSDYNIFKVIQGAKTESVP